MSTLGHQYDNSLVSNAFGFLRLPMNFQPYDTYLLKTLNEKIRIGYPLHLRIFSTIRKTG